LSAGTFEEHPLIEPVCEVIITADDEPWLLDFTRSLVEDRLVACGQHISPVRSVYRWDGAVHDDSEVRVALHTRHSLVPAIIERARTEHSYDVPCVIAVPIQTGNPDYLAWVIESTIGPGGQPPG
jgi:periplasmic divalent cation tolerance protein